MRRCSTHTSLIYFYVISILGIGLLVSAVTAPVTQASFDEPTSTLQSPIRQFVTDTIPTTSDGPRPTGQTPLPSPRLIVELSAPPLSVWWVGSGPIVNQGARGPLNTTAPDAQNYIAQLQSQQAAFVQQMQNTLPNARVATFINERNQQTPAAYQVVFNGLSVEVGQANLENAQRTLAKLPGVKGVYADRPHLPALYTSTTLINAPILWNDSAIGGQANAGRGIKVASMDGGVHKDAPMFSGTGYTYPVGFPTNGLGLTANNNGKIIASRAYFRSWDPPAPGDENPWPGVAGTPHGVHTAGIAGGNNVTTNYQGITVTLSGVAPAAWIMSYRVFYASINGNASFYDTEGIAALEDIVRDGAQVVNNSWGEGPTATGGLYDPLDQALINASRAGVFVSMSAGNSGPGPGTVDHPSSDYINVAASTTSGTFAAGRVSVSAPLPISPSLQNMAYTVAQFGTPVASGGVYTYNFVAAAVISPTNANGCSPWPAGTFTGKAAVISRGVCEFGQKVLYAQNAGATFAVIYNNAGDTLLNMGPGAVGISVTIPSIFIWQSKGLGMVSWYTTNGAASELTFDTLTYQAGNVPDIIAGFSSRGPGVGNVLKPDIAAPGVNILSQGYAPGATGEARHLGFGEVSGTSMAAPHVAGAAALLRQVRPTWSNAYIKSALMSTSKYMGIYLDLAQTIPAQPLDMGAGRLDLANAANPGIILDPPSLSFGHMLTGTSKTINVMVTSVATQTETYTLSTLYTGGGFTATTALPGFTVSPASITLSPGASTMISVTFNSVAGRGLGDNQGYIILDGAIYDGHMPAWARVTYVAAAQVLIIDNDGSTSLGNPNYLGYYTRTLTNLGYTYSVLNVDAFAGPPANRPSFLNTIDLLAYPMIIYFTGNNFNPSNAFAGNTVPLTAQDMDKLTEYVNNGGKLIAMGQDMASVLGALNPNNAPFFYSNVLGASYLQDSLTGNGQPTLPIGPLNNAPLAFQSISLNVGGNGAGYTLNADLSGSQEVTPVVTTMSGKAVGTFFAATRLLNYSVVISQVAPFTITAAHIHSGTVGVNGGIQNNLLTTAVVVTNSNQYTLTGFTTIATGNVNRLLSGDMYINVHTNVNPGGEVRGQIAMTLFAPAAGDGAFNQIFIDEIHPAPPLTDFGDPNNPAELNFYKGLLRYPGSNKIEDGAVASSHRAQPSLERPGISYLGRSIYTTFGLEGVNNGVGATSREQLLRTFINLLDDNPTVAISNTTNVSNTSQLTYFDATVTSNITNATGVSYRWDFGDGSPFAGPYTTRQASHMYANCGNYKVRVEATDSYGNVTIGEKQIIAVNCAAWKQYLPLIVR